MNIHRIPLIYGVLAGVLTILAYFIAYIIDPTYYFHNVTYWSTFILFIFFMGAAAYQYRKRMRSEGGEPGLRSATRQGFIVWIIANAIFYIFNYAMFNYVEPELNRLALDKERETLEWFEEKAIEAEEDERLEEIRAAKEASSEDVDYITVWNSIKLYVFSLIPGFIVSLIFGLIFKRGWSLL